MSPATVVETTQEEIDSWKEAREHEGEYWRRLFEAAPKVPDRWQLEAACNTIVNYLTEALIMLDGLAYTAYRETNKEDRWEPGDVGFDQVGLLLGEMAEVKTFAELVVEQADKLSECTLHELHTIAHDGELPFQSRFDEHGYRRSTREWR